MPPRGGRGLTAGYSRWCAAGSDCVKARDGSEALPRMLPLRTRVTMVVADGLTRYEREIRHAIRGVLGDLRAGRGAGDTGW